MINGDMKNLDDALEILQLPRLITKEDIKKQYHFLSKKYHPDYGGERDKMEKINHAYKILMKYIEEFRYTFDHDEVEKQSPGASHEKRYRR